MRELSLSPPEEEEYTETCPHCKAEIDEIIYVRDKEIIGCESCIKQYELSEWAEKNYISKADIEAEKADMESDWRKYINE